MAADVDQLAGWRIGLGLQRFAYGLVAAAHGGDRQHGQRGVEQPPCGSAAHLASHLNDHPDNEREQGWGTTTQLSTWCTAADPLSKPRPSTAMNAAGAVAHLCG